MLQMLPLAVELESVTLPPAQKVSGPLAWMLGWAGTGFTVTTTGWLTWLVQPWATVRRLKLPELLTVMLLLVCPLLQRPAEGAESVTLPPWQKVVGPPAEIVGAVRLN